MTFSNIHIFNPTCDFAIGNGQVSWRPNRLLQQFERDLDILPAFYAGSDDIVLVHQPKSIDFIKQMEDQGLIMPRFATFEQALNHREFITMSKHAIIPWGWSPVVHHQLKHLFPSCSANFQQSVMSDWNEQRRQLYSRKSAIQVLELLLPELTALPVIPAKNIPVYCQTIDEINEAHKKWRKSMFKAPWSSSGRGIQPAWDSVIHPSIMDWCRGVLNKQGGIICEPWYEKVADLALEFELNTEGIQYLGEHWFETNEKGAYQKSYFNCSAEKEIDNAVVFFNSIKKKFIPILKEVLFHFYLQKYVGMIGVDLLIFRKDGHLSLQPCLEINLRNNMGIVALSLSQQLKHQYRSFEIKAIEAVLPIDILLTPITKESKFCACLNKG